MPPVEPAAGVAAEPFCSEVARAASAPLAGTASRAQLWLLVEHSEPWGRDAVVDNRLPEEVRAWLAAQLAALESHGKPRALLVRQGRPGAAVRCFLAVARPERQELYRFAVGEPRGLATLDLAAGLADGALSAARSTQRLTLICTNGRRDRCCARHGLPTYAALAAREGDGVWQSTHQGGHRYAATGLWLPEGVAYGYLGPGDVEGLVTARRDGAIHLPRFRGRTFHSAPVQAADALLRRALGVERLDAWQAEAAERAAEELWRVVLSGPSGRHEVWVEQRFEEALAGCAPPHPKRLDHFALRSWRPL